jgi:segregation and condensation protein B
MPRSFARSRPSSSSPPNPCRPTCSPRSSSSRPPWSTSCALRWRPRTTRPDAGGYRYQSRGDLAPYVERFILDGQRARLSGAALETLAIVAYKQPISRSQIASIRGVDPDGVLRTLQSRGYIDQVGRDPGPGQAVMWGTTPAFLEKLGINSINDLPSIVDFVPDAEVVEALEQGLRIPKAADVITDQPSGAPSPE